MRLRKLALAVGLAGTLGANLATALGLGEITLNSALNQPLDAEIKLLKVRDLSEDEILVKLASREDFQRAGVDRLFYLTDLQFRIDLSNPSGPVIKLSSRKPIREPYLNFLLETQWPSGRMLREYTLLMDLPTFRDEAVRPIKGVQTQAVESAPAVTTRSRPVSRTAPASTQVSRPQVDVYGPVTSNDTLWEIALRVRPSEGVSVHQTMLALQRLNPGAFINNNINLLRKGQVLRVPSLDEIKGVSPRQAFNEVAYQNSQWSESPAVAGAQLEAASRSTASPRAPQEGQGRVRLLAPGASEGAGSGQVSSKASQGRVDSLENELAVALEELDKTKRENSDLAARMHELEEQMTTMQRLLEVSNQELRALQLASGEAVATPDAAETANIPAPDTTAPETQTENVASAVEPAAKTKPSSAAQPKKVIRAPAKPSLVDTLMDNILWVGGGVLALVAAIFLFLRRREEEEGFDEELEPFASESEMLDEDETLAAVDIDDDLFDEEEANLDVDLNDESDLVDDDLGIEPETGDVVGEADIYIAYGKFDQAEDMLLKALVSEPDNAQVLVKLLEVYAETQDLANFDVFYSRLQELGDESAIQRASELRQIIDGAGAFEPTVGEMAENALDSDSGGDDTLVVDDNGELDLDLDFEEDLDDLEFDLGEDALSLDEPVEGLHESPEDAAGEVVEPGLEDEPLGALGEQDTEAHDDLDFSLDFDAEKELAGAEEFEIDLDSDSTSEYESTLETGDQSDELDLAIDLDPADDAELQESELDTTVLSDSQGLGEDLDLDFELDAESDDDEALLDLSLDGELNEAEALEKDLEALSVGFDSSEEGSDAALEPDVNAETQSVEKEELALQDDDFNLDMDVGSVDLAALDQEVDNLAADLDLSSGEEFGLLDEGETQAGDSELTMDEPLTDFDLDANPEQSEESLSLESNADTLADLQDEVFAEALSGVPDAPDLQSGESLVAEDDALDEDLETELDFLSDTDESSTKLDLARAYIDMGDTEGAKDILDEVVQEGSEQQRSEAEELLGRIG